MSDALKLMLDEWDARIKAAPGPCLEALVVGHQIYNRARSRDHAELAARAPEDLAVASRLLRVVADAGYCADCGKPETWPHEDWPCHGCRIVREVEAGVGR